jgi:hypothetical protein
LAAAGNFQTAASLAFAGKATGQTDRGDARVFVSTAWRY